MAQKQKTLTPNDTIPGVRDNQNSNVRIYEVTVNDEPGYTVFGIIGTDLWGINNQLIALHGCYINIYTKIANVIYVNNSGINITINTVLAYCIYHKHLRFDEKSQKISTTSQVTMYSGASAINVSSGWAGLYYLGAVKYCYMDISFTLTNPNADYFSVKFSNVAMYASNDGGFSTGSTSYINLSVSDPQSYVFTAVKYGFRLMHNGSSIKGNDYTGNSKRFAACVWFV